MLQPITCDVGSSSIKAGFAGEEEPKLVFPTLMGRPRSFMRHAVGASNNLDDLFVGQEAQSRRAMLNLSYPITSSVFSDVEDMATLLQHVYQELGVISEAQERPILLTQMINAPKLQTEVLATIMFESFEVPALSLAGQPVLALYGSGATTGLVVSCGDGITQVVPVYNGRSLLPAVRTTNIGGRYLTDRLATMLNDRGYSFNSTREKEVVRAIKESLCCVALDAENEVVEAKEYELPDGQSLSLGKERFYCPEVLFNPEPAGEKTETIGIPEAAFQAITNCDVDFQSELFGNIVLAGGTTLLPGMADRMQLEMEKLAPSKGVRIVAPENRRDTTWIGSSIVASCSIFDHLWISKQEYQECGSSVAHRKSYDI